MSVIGPPLNPPFIIWEENYNRSMADSVGHIKPQLSRLNLFPNKRIVYLWLSPVGHQKFFPNQFFLVDCSEWKIMHLPLFGNFYDLGFEFPVNRCLKINTHAYPHIFFLHITCTNTQKVRLPAWNMFTCYFTISLWLVLQW